jgi:hypothetical protein
VSGCLHRHRIDGICLACGDCQHEVILNQRCYYCGTQGVEVTNKPKSAEALVPATSLVRGRDRQ